MRRHLLVAVVLVAVVNGLFSPLLIVVAKLAPLWFPAFLPPSPAVLLYLSSLLLSAVTLLLAGVPAAVYERLSGTRATDGVSATIWLAGVIVLTVPALRFIA
ncbi:MAG: hypothetical protein WD270_00365 [Acetobacterales bacterium]